uniref:Uncharacterized protein n=1 Tax=Solanum tuberosum TaxID=4113 RepID=M1DLE8_SOLTU
MKNLDIDIRDDISMASASHTNDDEESCMAGEVQSDISNEEIDIDTLLQRLQDQVEESSSNTACKGKGKIFERLSKESVGLPISQEGVRELGQTRIVEAFTNLARIVYTCKGTLSKTEQSVEILVSEPWTCSSYR